MFYMRIMATIVNTLIFYYMYKILKIIKINPIISILIVEMIFMEFIDILCIDYNVMILLIALIIMYYEIKNIILKDDLFDINIKREIIMSIISGICITIKQTTGVCFAIMYIGYKILGVRNKKDFRKYIKIFFIRLIGNCIPLTILILYLLKNNIYNEFLSYTIKGINEFANNISYISLLKGEEALLAVLVPITIIISFFYLMKKKDKLLITFFSYSVGTIIVVYPIADKTHFLIGSIISIILGIYLFKILLLEKIKKTFFKEDIETKLNKIKNILIFLNIGIVIICFFCIYNAKIWRYKELKNFKYIPTKREQKYEETYNYIKNSEKKVLILDSRAAIYMIPLNKYNKNFDMFNKGNFGENGEENLIEELKKNHNIQVLILKDKENLNWQTPTNILIFIIKNYDRIGEIGDFEIYEYKGD